MLPPSSALLNRFKLNVVLEMGFKWSFPCSYASRHEDVWGKKR
jgi:hypothetical protein